MSLSSVIQTAQNSLANMTRRTGVLARNVNDAGSASYARRDLQTITNAYGSQTANIRRATNLNLEKYALASESAVNGQKTLTAALESLKGHLAAENGGWTISNQLTDLNNSLQTYSSAPGNDLLAKAVVDKAKNTANSLNAASAAIQEFRRSTDKEISLTVGKLNGLLSDFKTANDTIRNGSQSGLDVNDALDARSALLVEISKIIPVSSYERDGNDMVLMTATGTTLFETVPRYVSFENKSAFAPGSEGNPVHIDVVKVGSGTKGAGEATGRLEALLQLRDVVAPALQKQFDELARSLIAGFAEMDMTGNSLAPLQGLFAWSGGPAFPSAGTLVDGLAGLISVNVAYDPDAGGNASRLRDGGANGAAYLQNTTNGSGYSTRLIGLAEGFDRSQVFDTAAGLGSHMSVHEFADSSAGWFAGLRFAAQQKMEAFEARDARAKENLSNETGVNIDLEMVKLGELEKGYEASARLLRAADQMLQELLDTVDRT